MVDSGSSAVTHEAAGFELNPFDAVPDLKVPPLCEIWNWQGDTSVLPYKFESVLNSASTFEEHYKHGELKEKYIKDARFNPDGFFFLTYRS